MGKLTGQEHELTDEGDDTQLKGQTAAAVKLRRGRVGDVEVGDAHTWHRRLSLDLAKLPDGFSSTARRLLEDGGSARVSAAARKARWRLGFWVGSRGGASAA
jgi:hypothetical protein